MPRFGSPADPTAPGDAVGGDDFLPAIDVAHLRASVRLDPAATPARLRDSVVNAILAVRLDLGDWIEAMQAAGCGTLADVPGPTIDGDRRAVILYRRAVYSLVGADLVEAFPGIGATAAGQARDEELAVTANEHRRNARWAVRDLIGRARSTVELI